MSDVTTIVETYIAAWNERDPDQRLRLVAETFTPDADYLDPLMSGQGHEAINAMIEAVQQQFPDHDFRLQGTPDSHHDRLRFGWTLTPEGEDTPVGVGVDFATLAEDGRLQSVSGFLVAA